MALRSLSVRSPACCALSALLAALAGCASPGVDYANALIDVEAPGAGVAVALSVRDRRPSSLRHTAEVGVVRMTMGIPLEVRTVSGGSLGQDVTSALSSALRDAGYQLTVVPAAAEISGADPLRGLRSSGRDRWLLFEIAEWRSDGYFGELTVHFDLRLRVYVDGALRSDLAQSGEATERYKSREAYARACLRVFNRVFSGLLAQADLDGGAAPKRPIAERCGSCQAALEPAWRVCPVCATPRRR